MNYAAEVYYKTLQSSNINRDMFFRKLQRNFSSENDGKLIT